MFWTQKYFCTKIIFGPDIFVEPKIICTKKNCQKILALGQNYLSCKNVPGTRISLGPAFIGTQHFLEHSCSACYLSSKGQTTQRLNNFNIIFLIIRFKLELRDRVWSCSAIACLHLRQLSLPLIQKIFLTQKVFWTENIFLNQNIFLTKKIFLTPKNIFDPKNFVGPPKNCLAQK